jgi:outer membrane protein, adhesin transport system
VKQKLRFGKTLVALAISGLIGASAQAAETLQGAASKAVLSNPEVMSKWHQFKASGHERDVSWGRYLPTLDVIFGTAYQKRDTPVFTNPSGERDYNFQTSRATLRQNIFEGFATKNDTLRLDHASMVRFYELLDLSETAALEAAKAYIDVWRYRQLVTYAEESYATHRVLYDKINQRTSSGVSRRVDLETAAGRLALAESNLLTENSNLHDVTARYQRIVGSLPPADMEPPPASMFVKEMPADRIAGVNRSFEKSPALKAALENILSAMRNTDVQKSGYYPRFDAYLEKVNDKNSEGYSGRTKETSVGLTMTWNLFKGGSDVARERKAAEEKNSAKDLREKVCRDVRQNSVMAYNDYLRLTEQLQFLDQHQLSTDKAREAFRRQFDIGQRTLLDVLDTENEYYTARSNYLNGEMDLEIAKVRYLATAGSLLSALKIQHLDAAPPDVGTLPEEYTQGLCPIEAPPAYEKPKPADRIILLPEADGRVGEVFIKRHGVNDELVLKDAYAAAEVSNKAAGVTPTSADEVKQRYSALFAEQRSYMVRFALGKTTLLPASSKVLQSAVAEYKQNRGPIALVGHADKAGTSAGNEKLSKARAETVRSALVAAGVNAADIAVAWQGDRVPLPETAGKVVDERNRRVEIRLE